MRIFFSAINFHYSVQRSLSLGEPPILCSPNCWSNRFHDQKTLSSEQELTNEKLQSHRGRETDSECGLFGLFPTHENKKKKLKKIWRRPISFVKMCNFMQCSLRSRDWNVFADSQNMISSCDISLGDYLLVFSKQTYRLDSPSHSNLITFS